MKYKYDSEADILVLTMSDEKPDFGEQSGPIVTHYTEKGKPVEIEILDASKTVLDLLKPILTSKRMNVTQS